MSVVERARVVRVERPASRWELVTRTPAPAFAPLVSRMLGYTERSPGRIERAEMPSSKVMMVIPLGPPIHATERDGRRLVRFSDGFVAGLDDGPGRTEHEGVQCGLRLDLTPQGARRLLGVPMTDLSGRIVSLRDLLPPQQCDMGPRLRQLPDWDARFDLLERVLSERFAGREPQHQDVGWAAQQIEKSCGRVNISELVAKLGYSHKHTLRLFREHIGLPPKLFARLVRFEAVRRAIRCPAPAGLAELADHFGYADQAHLVREVRHFSGRSPTALRLTSPLDAG
ncbi:MAG: helix-turn-helix domain-containing protein [Myxococcales bacterium]|nr:helix-turn-helix domain-containing protein [Myxococcales bacterium]MDD9970454.1 helix-turn-helix domain-containing protein [Myxococcales bacterium]